MAEGQRSRWRKTHTKLSSSVDDGRHPADGSTGEVFVPDEEISCFEETNPIKQPSLTFYAQLYSFCAALNSCNLGYDIGVSTNAGPLIQQDLQLSDGRLELFLGSINFWSIFGALISNIVTDRFGRRRTFTVTALGFITGVLVMVLAPNFTQLMFGRAIVGIAVGTGEAIDPQYISEISPKSFRGELVSWAEAGVAVGVVLGFCSSLLFLHHEVEHQWRYMLALGGIMPCIMLWLVWKVMPESPRWLLVHGEEALAKDILSRTHGEEEDIDVVVHNIKASLRLEEAAGQALGWSSILCRPSPAVQRMLLVGIGIAIIQQAVGIDSIMFYLVFVIKQTGVSSELGQLTAIILLGLVKLGFVFVGAKLFDRLGRRPLLFISLIGCSMSLVVVSVTFTSDSSLSKIMTVVGLATYLAFFSSGLGPGNWVVVSEVFATSIRSKGMSAAVIPNRVTATIMASTFLTIAKALTWPGFFLFLAGICFLGFLFLYKYLPETKGRTLEEMSHYFAELTGDRSILDVEERLGSECEVIEMGELSSETSVALT